MCKGQDRQAYTGQEFASPSTMHLGNKLGLKLGSYSQNAGRKQEDAQGPTELTVSQVDKVREHSSSSSQFKQGRVELNTLLGRTESRG